MDRIKPAAERHASPQCGTPSAKMACDRPRTPSFPVLPGVGLPVLAGVLMPDADDELAGGAVVLHVVVGLRHLPQAVVDAAHGEVQTAGRDRVEDLLEGLPGQVGGVAE